MSEIEMPFKEEFIEKIFLCQKTVTRRNEKYGDVGDYFEVRKTLFDDVVFLVLRIHLTGVYKEPLSKVDDEEARKEGCKNLEDFKKVWERIHPRRGWNPDDEVWVHRWD